MYCGGKCCETIGHLVSAMHECGVLLKIFRHKNQTLKVTSQIARFKNTAAGHACSASISSPPSKY